MLQPGGEEGGHPTMVEMPFEQQLSVTSLGRENNVWHSLNV
jgi:hypothetical protein